MMDYLEGFLIGSIWSDTDYRTRRHYHAHVFLATLMAAAFAFFLFFPDRMSKVGCRFATALPCFPYFSDVGYADYFEYLLSRAFLCQTFSFAFVHHEVRVCSSIRSSIFSFRLLRSIGPKISDLLFARIDDHMTRSLDRFSDSGRVLTTVAGVLIGAFWIIAEGLLVVLILIAVPLAAICLLKGIRYVIDIVLYELIDRFIIKDALQWPMRPHGLETLLMMKRA